MRAPEDVVFFEDLLLRLRLGVNPEEHVKPQDVLVSARFGTDASCAARSGALADAVDYRAVKKRMMALAEARHHGLVEELAEALAGCALEDPRVAWAWIRVEKPGALRHARTVGVEVTRRRGPGQADGSGAWWKPVTRSGPPKA